MLCQPAARTPKPLSHRLEQDSRGCEASSHTLTHATHTAQKIAVEAQFFFFAEGKADLMSVFGDGM